MQFLQPVDLVNNYQAQPIPNRDIPTNSATRTAIRATSIVAIDVIYAETHDNTNPTLDSNHVHYRKSIE